jgi:thiol-disulfide isomerase/thioredoxin
MMMRLRSLLTIGLGAVALLMISTAPRPSHAYRAIDGAQRAQEGAGQKGVGVRVGIGESKGRTGVESMTVREIDVPALKELLQPKAEQPRPLLVNFWATWCDPCREEFPDLVRIDADYRARGLEFITISLDDTSQINTNVPQFLKEMKASMPAYLLNTLDPDEAIAAVDRTWHGALPATFLFDARGQVVFKHMGRIKAAELRAAIEKVLSEK